MTPVGRVALLSIHPRHADAILDGRKRVEFRKRRLADDVTHVVLYATSPVQRVVGGFVVAGQVTDSPAVLADRYADRGASTPDRLAAYYGDAAEGTAILVGRVGHARPRLPLVEATGLPRAPMSVAYLSPEFGWGALAGLRPALA